MKGEWCYFKNYFTPEQCQNILDLGLQISPRKATLGVEGQSVNESYQIGRAHV